MAQAGLTSMTNVVLDEDDGDGRKAGIGLAFGMGEGKRRGKCLTSHNLAQGNRQVTCAGRLGIAMEPIRLAAGVAEAVISPPVGAPLLGPASLPLAALRYRIAQRRRETPVHRRGGDHQSLFGPGSPDWSAPRHVLGSTCLTLMATLALVAIGASSVDGRQRLGS